MDRSNHYEAAFEAYLQWHRLGYVAVDETRRAMLGQVRVKSLDFIVFGAGGSRLVIDVKGRRFPAGPPERPRRVWECWSTREDIDGLLRWAALAGPDYQPLLAFAYQLQPEVAVPGDTDDLWTWRGRRYLLRAVPAEAYRRHMRVRSPKWNTVALPTRVFRSMVRPLHEFIHPRLAVGDVCPF
jgi:hypothetical protein